MNYKEAKELVSKYDSALLASDTRFRHTTEIEMEDGSFFKWKNAFIMKFDCWMAIFTEHYGFHIFDLTDIITFTHYHEIGNIKKYISKLETLNE